MINIPDSIWSISTSNGQGLGERVARKAPTVRTMDEDAFLRFVNVWNERLNDALETSNSEMKIKAQLILEFLKENQPPGISLLLWGDYKLSAIYNCNLEKIFLLE